MRRDRPRSLFVTMAAAQALALLGACGTTPGSTATASGTSSGAPSTSSSRGGSSSQASGSGSQTSGGGTADGGKVADGGTDATTCTGGGCDGGGDAGEAEGEAGDACGAGGCACGDAGLVCSSSQACAGAACTCLVACDHGTVMRSDGELWTYVYHGTSITPVAVTQANGAPFVATAFATASADTTCAIASDATLWCWNAPGTYDCDGGACSNDNMEGVLGNGTTAPTSVPTQVLTSAGHPLENVRGVAVGSVGGETACAVDAAAHLYCWGFSEPSAQTLLYATLVTTADGMPFADVAQVSVELWQMCALKTDGTVWCSGENEPVDGGTPETFPVQIPLPGPAVAVRVDTTIGLALLADGTVWFWTQQGKSIAQVLEADGKTPLSDVIAVQAMNTNSCALKSDRSYACWPDGENTVSPPEDVGVVANDGGTTYMPAPEVYVLCGSHDEPTFISTSGDFYFTGRTAPPVPCP